MATLKAIFTAQDNLSSAMAKAGSAGSKTTSIMSKLGKIGSKAMKGIVTAVTLAGTALLGLGKNVVKTGMEWETSMSQVMATMGIDKNSTFVTSTGEIANSYEMLSAASKKMGAETAFTSSQAADALNYLALAGYDAEQATAALPTVLHLAGAGNMDLAAASDMVTDSMAALGLEVNQVNLDRFADQMAKTASTTNTSVAQLGEATLTVGAVAKNLRNGTTELNTQLGILANVGIKGAEGGTHLRNILLRLQNPTAKATKQLDKLGVSVYDADGKMRDTGAIFLDLKKSMQGMSQQEIDQVMSTIFNKTDIAAANALLAASGDEYERIFNIIENSNGAAAEMYSTMLDNLSGDVAIFKSATEALYLAMFASMGDGLRGFVQTGTEYMTRLLEAFNEGGFEGLVTELGNVLGDAVGEIMSFAPKIIEAGTSIVLALVESIGNNADTIAEGAVQIGEQLVVAIAKIAPKLAVALGKTIGSAAASLMRTLPQLLGKIPDSFYNALGLDKHTVVTRFGKFAGHIAYAFRMLVKDGDVFGFMDRIGKAFGLDESKISGIKNVITQLGAAFEKVKNIVVSVVQAVAKLIGKFADIGGLEAIIAGLVAGFIALKAINIGKTFVGFAKGIKKAGGVMKVLGANKFLLIATAIAAVVAGIVLLVKNWDKVKESVGKGIDSIFGAGSFDKLSTSLSKVGQTFGEIGVWAKDSFSKMKTAFDEGYKKGGLFGGIKSAFDSVRDSLSEVDWSGIWNGVKDTASELWEKLKTAVSTAITFVKLWFLSIDWAGIWTSIKNTASSLWEKLKTVVTDAKDKAVEWFESVDWDGIWNKITSTASDLWEKMKTAAVLAWIRVKLWFQGIDWAGIWNKITNTASDLWEKMKTVASDAKDKVVEWFGSVDWGSIWNTISTTFVSLWGKLKTAASLAVAFVKAWFMTVDWSGIWDGIKGTAASLWENVKSALEDASGEGGVIGALSSALSSAMETAESITSEVSSAITTLQSNGTIGEIWNSVKSIVQSIWGIVQQIVSAFTGEMDGAAADTSGLSNTIVAGVQLISDAVQAMAEGLKWLSDVIGKLDEAGALVPLLEGLGAAIATYFTASAIMNIVNFFKAFSAGQAIFAALNPHILAIAAAVAGLVALIVWARNSVKREDKTWGDYKDFDLQEIEMRVDTTIYPEITNGEQAMAAIDDQIAQMVDRGTITADVGSKLSQMYGEYITPEGFDMAGWYETGRSAALDLLNGVSDGMDSGDAPNPADEIVSTMNETFESVTGQTVDFSGMFADVDTSASQAAADATSTLDSIMADYSGADLSTAGAEAGAGYVEGLGSTDPTGGAASLVTAAEDAVRSAQQSGSPAAAFMPMGAEAAQGYGMGLMQEDITSYATSFATTAMTAVQTTTQAAAAALTLEAEGIKLIETYSNGIQGNMSAATGAAIQVANGVKTAASSINLTSVGASLIRGLINGINSMKGSLLATAQNISNQLKSTIQQGLEVHSPSRFTDWVGTMLGKGLINGIDGMTAKATAAAAAMAFGVTSAFAPVALATPSISAPMSVSEDYGSAASSFQPSATPYEALGGDNNSGESGEHRIVIDINGGGRIDISGLTKEQAMELIAERVKPELMAVLEKEIVEGGNGVYEF